MMSRFCFVVIASVFACTLFFGGSVKANEDTDSGNSIFEGCKAFSEGGGMGRATVLNALKGAKCAGLIEGITVQAMADHRVCLPDGVTRQQEAKVVVKYMTDHPADLNLDETVLIFGAIYTAWPCSKENH